MAWLQKRKNVWWIGWRHQGREFRRSTGEKDREKAKLQLERLNTLETARHANALTEEFYGAVTGRTIQKVTTAGFLTNWLREAEGTTSRSTANKYGQVVREFSKSIGAESSTIYLEDITTNHIQTFLSEKRQHLAPGTVKGYRRILSSIFLLAQNLGHIKSNPVALTRGGKRSEDSTEKRPFTLAEVHDLHARANPFWRYMIITGFFTGQSLGDIILLGPRKVNLAEGVIQMYRKKTNKRVIIPIAKPLRDFLLTIWAASDAEYFFPDQASRYLKSGASAFSQEFYELLAACGLVAPRSTDKLALGKGRNTLRKETKLGFHNLRHTFVTQIKMGGAVDSIAKELAGHTSTAVNTQYTHLPIETLAKAITALPNFLEITNNNSTHH